MAVANSTNISTIQILRSYANSTPSTLADGQLAYSFVSNTLFIGSNTGIKTIGDASAAVIARSAQANTIYTQGVDTTQNTAIAATNDKMSSAYNQANTGTVLAQAAFNTANNVFPQIQPSFNVANSASANTIITQGVDVTQNTRLTIIEGTDVGQNTAIAAIDSKMQSAYNQANVTAGGLITANANSFYIQSGLNSANANVVVLFGINTTQNSWISSNSSYFQGIDNSQNSSIQFLTGNTSPNLYLTTVGSSVNSIAVGGAPIQNAQVWGTYTIVQVLDTLLFPTTGPTYTIPTITLSANNSGTFEIGQSINQSLSVTGNKNDAGSFTQIRINRNTINLTTNNSPTITPIANIAAQFGYADPNNQNYSYANTYIDANTIVSGTTTWTGYGNYNAGLAKLNNKGATDTNAFAILTTTAPQAANATTFATSSASITGIYPYFWGVSSTQPTTATIAAAIQAGTTNRVLAVGSGTLTITYNASSQYVWLAVQTGYATKTAWYNTALNNGSIGAGQFILSPVSQAVISPNGYWSGVTYNVYISGYATTTSGSIQFS